MSRKRANGESIDAMRMRTDDMMMCVDAVDSIKKCRNGGAYEMADVKEYSSSITQEDDSGPKRAIVSFNFVNYLTMKLQKCFFLNKRLKFSKPVWL